MRIIIAGDTHGNQSQVRYLCDQARLHDCERIVQVGDWGFLWPGAAAENRLKILHDALVRDDLYMDFLDGNHEGFPLMAEKGAVPSATEAVNLTSRVRYLPRGFRWEWDGVKFMSVGGAFSIDLPYRKVGKSWWAEEEITEDDVARACAGGEVDVMLTHDAPECPPRLASMLQVTEVTWRETFGARWNRELSPRSKKCREAIAEIALTVRPKLLVHGHYHWHYTDVWHDIQILGLDRDGTGLKSWTILDTETFPGRSDG